MKASMLHVTLWWHAATCTIDSDILNLQHGQTVALTYRPVIQVIPSQSRCPSCFTTFHAGFSLTVFPCLAGPLADQYTPRLCISLRFSQLSRAVLYSIAALSILLSRNVLTSEDHQSSIRCDLWTFWSVRGGGPSVHSSGCQDNSGSEIGVHQKGQSRVKILEDIVRYFIIPESSILSTEHDDVSWIASVLVVLIADDYDVFCRLSLLGILYLMHMLLYGMKSGITTWTVPTCRSDVSVGQFWDTPRRLPPSTLAQILRRDDISIVHENEAGLRYPVVGIKRFVVSVLVIECYWYTISAERRNLQQPRYEVYKNIQMICLWYLWHQNIRDIDIYDNIPVARSQVPRIGAATIGCQIFDFVVEMASSLISSGRGDEAHGTLCGIQWLISYCFLKCFWFSGKTTVFGCIHMYSTSRYMETLSKYHN